MSSHTHPAWSAADLRFLEDALSHMTAQQIADKLGRTKAAVYGMVSTRGLTGIARKGKPLRLKRWQQSYLMRAMRLKRSLSNQRIAERLGICEASVSNYFHRMTAVKVRPVQERPYKVARGRRTDTRLGVLL